MGQSGLRRASRAGLLALAVLLAVGCSPSVRPSSPMPPSPVPSSAAPSSASPSAGGTTIDVDGRPVLVHAPASGSPGPLPLVVVLHGYTGNAAGAVAFFGMRELADQRGFLVAAPEGTTDEEGDSFWNASDACCDFHGSEVDDSAHLSRMIETMVAEHGADPARVYVVGHSNGGFMALRFACEHAEQVAAVASLAGAMDAGAECEPSRPVSVVQVHGDDDPTVRFDGGTINGAPHTSAKETVALWRRLDDCGARSNSGDRIDADALVDGDDLAATAWRCAEDTTVALWRIEGGGHVPALTAAFSEELYDWLDGGG